MELNQLLSLLLIVLLPGEEKALTFTNVTDQVGLSNVEGNFAVAAFSDANVDKHLDILLVNQTDGGGDELSLLLWNGHQFVLSVLRLPHRFKAIIATATADFDGDGWTDALIVCSNYEGTIVWGSEHTLSGNITSLGHWKSAPLILDANGDHLPDIFAISENRKRALWLSRGESHSFDMLLLNQSGVATLVEEGSVVHAEFVDINSDCLSDLLLSVRYSNGSLSIEFWLKNPQSGLFEWSTTLWPAIPHRLISPPTFQDMNGDAVIDVVYLSCSDATCSSNATTMSILWQSPSSSVSVLDCRPPTNWSSTFQLCSYQLGTSLNPNTVIIHRPVLGDIDLDGYPDLLVSSSSPLLFLNVPSASCVGGREMHPQNDLQTFFNTTTVIAALYFDLWENGILDIFLVIKDDNNMRIEALQQWLASDHMFLKVTTLSGYCYRDCQSHIEPFGSMLPGCVVAMETTGRNGNTERTVAVSVLGSSALNNPHLPFLLIGLAATPNYIERLTIGVGHNNTHQQQNWHREWRLLVPNAQVILVPSPSASPSHWSFQLYLTTTQQLYSVTATFLIICIVLLVVVLLLHAREKFQDAKLRKEAMQKFHFSAM